jgi:hypothetical protein
VEVIKSSISTTVLSSFFLGSEFIDVIAHGLPSLFGGNETGDNTEESGKEIGGKDCARVPSCILFGLATFRLQGSKYNVYIAERDRNDERAGNEIDCLEEDEEKTDTNKDGKLDVRYFIFKEMGNLRYRLGCFLHAKLRPIGKC